VIQIFVKQPILGHKSKPLHTLF